MGNVGAEWLKKVMRMLGFQSDKDKSRGLKRWICKVMKIRAEERKTGFKKRRSRETGAEKLELHGYKKWRR